MKSKKWMISIMLLAATSAVPVLAASTQCTAKQAEIRTQLNRAKLHGNAHQVAGLEEALSDVTEYCTDSDLQREHQDKVAEKERKVEKRQRELDDARQSGRQDKITEKMQKLSDAKEALVKAKSA